MTEKKLRKVVIIVGIDYDILYALSVYADYYKLIKRMNFELVDLIETMHIVHDYGIF